MSPRSMGSRVLGRVQGGESLVSPTVILPAPSCSQRFLEAGSRTCQCLLVHFKKKKRVFEKLFSFHLTELGQDSVACKRLSFAMCSIFWNLARSLPGRGGRMKALA